MMAKIVKGSDFKHFAARLPSGKKNAAWLQLPDENRRACWLETFFRLRRNVCLG